jgi:hypothetical protein
MEKFSLSLTPLSLTFFEGVQLRTKKKKLPAVFLILLHKNIVELIFCNFNKVKVLKKVLKLLILTSRFGLEWSFSEK